MLLISARRTETVVVLKGTQTLVTTGETSYSNSSGNEGMATGRLWRRFDRYHSIIDWPESGTVRCGEDWLLRTRSCRRYLRRRIFGSIVGSNRLDRKS